MSVVKVYLYAIGMLMLICQVGMAQEKSKTAELKEVDLDEAASEQVIDEEVIADTSKDSETGDARVPGEAGVPQKCVPVEKKEGGAGDEAGEDGDGVEEVVCEPVYVPVEPPPVLSDEIKFTNPANPGAETARKLKEEYDAVVSALGGGQVVGYKNYQFDVPDRSISFAQYSYNNYRKTRNAGIVIIGVGVPVFGGLTALGTTFLAQALSDGCLPSNDTDGDCKVPSRRDAEDKKEKGIFLLAFGSITTIASVVTGAVIIKRNNGPMKSLAPLLGSRKKSDPKQSLRLIGVSPMVATNRSIGPGANLAISF